MTIIKGFKLDYQRPEPRIVKAHESDATRQAIAALKFNRRSVRRD